MAKNLELYIHIPFCVRKCYYCDFLSFASDVKTQEEYTESLIREIEYYGPKMRDYHVSTIYIGGGTPTWLEESLMLRILDALYQNFVILDEVELSMECNPGTVTASKLAAYRRAGVNRLSIGLQSTDDEELKILGRIHTYDQFLKTYEMARNAGFPNINIDLMSGLPYQNAQKFAKNLQQVIRLKPEHISAYTLMIEKGTPFYETYKFDAVRQEAGMKTEVLPDEDEAYRIYKVTQMILKDAGYEQYEISNYAKPGFECIHNVGYWTRENYLGLGLGAASLVENVRYLNTSDLYRYIEETKNISQSIPETSPDAIFGTNLHDTADAVLRKSQMEEFMFLGLRMTNGVTRDDFMKAFGISIEAIYQDVMTELKNEDLLQVQNGHIFLTDKGMDLSNYVLSKFLLS